MKYYREYIEMAGPGGPYVALVRVCHDFPKMALGDTNQVAVFDERTAACLGDDLMADAGWPTESFAVAVMA